MRYIPSKLSRHHEELPSIKRTSRVTLASLKPHHRRHPLHPPHLPTRRRAPKFEQTHARPLAPLQQPQRWHRGPRGQRGRRAKLESNKRAQIYRGKEKKKEKHPRPRRLCADKSSPNTTSSKRGKLEERGRGIEKRLRCVRACRYITVSWEASVLYDLATGFGAVIPCSARNQPCAGPTTIVCFRE